MSRVMNEVQVDVIDTQRSEARVKRFLDGLECRIVPWQFGVDPQFFARNARLPDGFPEVLLGPYTHPLSSLAVGRVVLHVPYNQAPLLNSE